MKRKLASIQVISDLQPIDGADRIERASILGWNVVVRKGEFSVGDKCIYCEIDSKLPAKPEFEFLAKAKYRIKTIKLRGQISQGICFPLSVLPEGSYEIGDDVTEILGVVKYEMPLPRRVIAGDTKGAFPGYVPKTDEIRIQSAPEVLEELRGTKCYVSVKIDGTSATFCRYDDEVEVCSRNRSIKEVVRAKRDDGSYREITPVYWQMYHKYKLDKVFEVHNHLAIQGEIAGFWDGDRNAIQGNRLGLKETELFVFDVFDILEHRYFDLAEMIGFCAVWDLQPVPICYPSICLDHTVEELLKMAEGHYPSGYPREGIVVRPWEGKRSKALNGRASFKVINNEFLFKQN
jgi:RNA ligase (TIGR02306 family)